MWLKCKHKFNFQSMISLLMTTNFSDLGAHVDGFIAVVAHTVVVGGSSDNKVTGRKADVILAAHYASQAALRLLKAGNETYAVTDAVQKVAEAYKGL